MLIPATEREALGLLMAQCEADLKSAHEQICKAGGVDPGTRTWSGWSPQANTIRWIAEIRKKFNLSAQTTTTEQP